MRVTHALVYFSRAAIPGFDLRTAAAYEIQKKVKAHFGVTDFKVFTNFDVPGDPHIVKVDNVRDLGLTDQDGAKANKIQVIREACKLTPADTVLFIHDFDAWQNIALEQWPESLKTRDLLLTTYYAGKGRINTGVMFVRGQSKRAIDAFEEIDKIQLERKACYDERGFNWLINSGRYADCISVIDNSWNLAPKKMEATLKEVGKPIKVCHAWLASAFDGYRELGILSPEVDTILGGLRREYWSDLSRSAEPQTGIKPQTGVNQGLLESLRLLAIAGSKRRPRWLPWNDFLPKELFSAVAEIGVRHGDNLERFYLSNAKVYGIDMWRNLSKETNDKDYTQEELDQQYQDVKARFADRTNVEIIRASSHEASLMFQPESLDLAYIDADHSYKGCKQDLADWWPKIRKGRILCGHDYIKNTAPKTRVVFGVIQAVDEFAAKLGLPVHLLPHSNWALIKPE